MQAIVVDDHGAINQKFRTIVVSVYKVQIPASGKSTMPVNTAPTSSLKPEVPKAPPVLGMLICNISPVEMGVSPLKSGNTIGSVPAKL